MKCFDVLEMPVIYSKENPYITKTKNLEKHSNNEVDDASIQSILHCHLRNIVVLFSYWSSMCDNIYIYYPFHLKWKASFPNHLVNIVNKHNFICLRLPNSVVVEDYSHYHMHAIARFLISLIHFVVCFLFLCDIRAIVHLPVFPLYFDAAKVLEIHLLLSMLSCCREYRLHERTLARPFRDIFLL